MSWQIGAVCAPVLRTSLVQGPLVCSEGRGLVERSDTVITEGYR